MVLWTVVPCVIYNFKQDWIWKLDYGFTGISFFQTLHLYLIQTLLQCLQKAGPVDSFSTKKLSNRRTQLETCYSTISRVCFYNVLYYSLSYKIYLPSSREWENCTRVDRRASELNEKQLTYKKHLSPFR